MSDLPIVHVPRWALVSGLPAPGSGEGFRAYCVRLGIEEEVIADLLEGLEGRTLEVANMRLAHYLTKHLPRAFAAGVAALNPPRVVIASAAPLREEIEEKRRTDAMIPSADAVLRERYS